MSDTLVIVENNNRKETGRHELFKKTSQMLKNAVTSKPKAPLVTAEDLVLGKEIATDVPGLTLTLAKGSNKEDLDIGGGKFPPGQHPRNPKNHPE
jgi:hypothetical protein